MTCAWCLFVLHILTHNPGVQGPGLCSDVLHVLTPQQHVAVLDKQLAVPKCPQTGAALGLHLTLGGVVQVFQPQTGSNACLKCSYLGSQGLSPRRVGCYPSDGTCLEWERMTCTSSTANAIAAVGKDTRSHLGKPETCYLLTWDSSHNCRDTVAQK